jgi:hypothetical protein
LHTAIFQLYTNISEENPASFFGLEARRVMKTMGYTVRGRMGLGST